MLHAASAWMAQSAASLLPCWTGAVFSKLYAPAAHYQQLLDQSRDIRGKVGSYCLKQDAGHACDMRG